jgi:hypothetical protein
MNILPFEKYSVKTTKPKSDISEILLYNTETDKFWPRFGFIPSEKPFRGVISSDRFKIMHPLKFPFRNSFLPVIIGEIVDREDGSVVNIFMRTSISSIVFMIFWISFFTFALISGIVTGEKWLILTPIIFICFGYGLMYFCFRFEAVKCKKLIAGILEASE